MKSLKYASQLLNDSLIDQTTYNDIVKYENEKPFSVNNITKLLMYAGITCLASGTGILIYKHINSFGHQLLLALIFLVTVFCFAYGAWQREPFDNEKSESPHIWYDYVLMLGALMLILLIGYAQYQYNLFNDKLSVAAFIPFAIIAFSAYFFDHLGLLSMAIVLLASWLGITVTPIELLTQNNFNSATLIYTGIGLALFLFIMSYTSVKTNFKAHFEFTYFNFGFNTGFIAALSGLFILNPFWVWYFVIAVCSIYCVRYALHHKSFYVMVLTIVYSYIALCHLLFKIMDALSIHSPYLALFWFIFSSIIIIKSLRDLKHKMQDDSI